MQLRSGVYSALHENTHISLSKMLTHFPLQVVAHRRTKSTLSFSPLYGTVLFEHTGSEEPEVNNVPLADFPNVAWNYWKASPVDDGNDGYEGNQIKIPSARQPDELTPESAWVKALDDISKS
jgi:hypothetical protein